MMVSYGSSPAYAVNDGVRKLDSVSSPIPASVRLNMPGVLKGAKNPEGAKFIEFLLSDEVRAQFRRQPCTPTKGVRHPGTASLALWPISPLRVDPQEIEKDSTAWLKTRQKRFLGDRFSAACA